MNLSGDLAQEYFVDGMTDGLINALGRISAVSVKARTSVMAFKGIKKEHRRDCPRAERGRHRRRIGAADLEWRRGRARYRERHRSGHADPVVEHGARTQPPSVLTIHAELARAIAESINVALTGDEQRRLAEAPRRSIPRRSSSTCSAATSGWAAPSPQLQRASNTSARPPRGALTMRPPTRASGHLRPVDG